MMAFGISTNSGLMWIMWIDVLCRGLTSFDIFWYFDMQIKDGLTCIWSTHFH